MPRKTALTVTPELLNKPAARRVAAATGVPVEAVVLGAVACWLGYPALAVKAVADHFAASPADLRGVLMSQAAPKQLPGVYQAPPKPATQPPVAPTVCVDPPPQAPPKRVPKTAEAAPKPRERNLLFDAIAEVCGVDTTLKAKAGMVGKVAAALGKADPPYSPEEVRQFGQRFWELCTWAQDNGRDRPTPTELEKWIDRVRAVPVARQAAVPPSRMTAGERQSAKVVQSLFGEPDVPRPAVGGGCDPRPLPGPRPAGAAPVRNVLPPHPGHPGSGHPDAGVA